MSAASDERIVSLFCESGDQRYFTELVLRYKGRLRRLLYTLLPDSPEDREDAEQEIFASLFSDLPRFRFQSAFATYFYRYCRNKAVDIIRKNARERRKYRRLTSVVPSHDRSAASPEEDALRNEAAQEVLRAVLDLPKEERMLLFLKESEGFSVGQIAEILAVPVGTVKSRLHRTRNRVVDALRTREEAARTVAMNEE